MVGIQYIGCVLGRGTGISPNTLLLCGWAMAWLDMS